MAQFYQRGRITSLISQSAHSFDDFYSSLNSFIHRNNLFYMQLVGCCNMKLVNVYDCYAGSTVENLSITVVPNPNWKTRRTLPAGIAIYRVI